MLAGTHDPAGAPAYRTGAAILVFALLVILLALGFEYIGGYAPCPLCLQQRYAYYAGIPLLFLALVALSAGQKGLSMLLFALVGLAFVGNAGLGIYHAGAEWGFWPGPETCAAAPQKLSLSAKDLLAPSTRMGVVRCDQAAWRFLGISFAGYNVLISILIAYGCAAAARQIRAGS
ncbi:MAG: disulfide bond formation protein B [Hyphomicrobiaceae bacterium]|nr:disulfide bond formation protein B [Hyphomicrobiaceae bacterium]